MKKYFLALSSSRQVPLDKLGYKAKFAVLPDGGDENNIIIHEKGFMRLKIEILSQEAHAARPWLTQNPIEQGTFFFNVIRQEFPLPENEEDWKTSVVFTLINSGSWSNMNVIPKSAEIILDIRYLDKKEDQEIIRKLNNILAENQIEYKLEVVAQNNPLLVSKSNNYVIKLRREADKIIGKNPNFAKESATSDAVFFTNHGIPAVLYRPQGGDAHTSREWVSQKSLFTFYKIIFNFLKNLKER